MSSTVNIHEAKTHFSKLIARVMGGEEVMIARAGKPVARLVPIGQRPKERMPGSAADKVILASDFDEPLPESVLADFEG